MASVQDCEQALLALADRFAAVDAQTRSRYTVDRTVSWHVTDLDVVFSVRVSDGELGALQQVPAAAPVDAQVRLAACSDDLVALATGGLTPPAAWATGRLKVEASVLDLLRLRSWL